MEKQKRPKILEGTTRKVKTGCGAMYVTITVKDGEPFEVFGILGKAGGCPKCQTEGLTRCITTGLRHGVPIQEYIKQLTGLACPNPALELGEAVKSCPDAIAVVMKAFMEGENEDNSKSARRAVKAEKP